MKNLLYIGLFFMLASQFPLLAQQIIYVKQDATGKGDGTSWEDAYTDLVIALDNSQENDEVWIAGGVYYPTQGIDRNASFVLKSGQKWRGGFAGSEDNQEQRRISRNSTYLSGNIGNRNLKQDNSYTVVTALNTDTTTLLDGVDIVDGYASGSNGDQPSDRQGNGGGLHVTIDNIPLGGVKLSQVDFRRNFSHNHGGSITYLGVGGSRAVVDFDITFFYGSESRDGANIMYLTGLADEIQHKFVDTQVRGGGVASLNTEFALDLEGIKQRVYFESTIAGQFDGKGKNGFMSFKVAAENCEINFVETQLFESVIEQPFVFQQVEGDMTISFDRGFMLDIVEEKENLSSTFLDIDKLNHDLNTSLTMTNIEWRRSHFARLIDISDLNLFTFYSNNWTLSTFKEAALYVKPKSQNVGTYDVFNNVFLRNNGPLLKGSTWDGNHKMRFFNNTLRANDVRPDITTSYSEEMAFFTLSDINSEVEILNNIFFQDENLQTLFNLQNVGIKFHHNMYDGIDCSDAFYDLGGISIDCKGNLFSEDPLFNSEELKDFSLITCSPAIDAGVTIIADYFEKDHLAENARNLGAGIDIGAVEHIRVVEETLDLCLEKGAPIEFPDFGTSPYRYDWINQDGFEGNGVDLEGGKYALTVTDDRGCTAFANVTVSTPGRFDFENERIDQIIKYCEAGGKEIMVNDRYNIVWPDGSTTQSFLIVEPLNEEIEISDGCITERYLLRSEPHEVIRNTTSHVLCEDDTLSLTNLIVTEAGLYQDTLFNRDGCDSLITIFEVESSTRLPIEIEGSLEVCEGSTAAVNLLNVESVEWSNGENDLEVSLEKGIFMADLIDKNGCRQLETVEIKYFPKSDWINSQQIIKDVSENRMITLASFPAEAFIIDVFPSEDVTFTEKEVNFFNQVSREYVLAVEYGNGCIDFDTVYVEVPFDPRQFVNIANAFSPNRDGENDVLFVQVSEGISVKEFVVVDRWGSMVYQEQPVLEGNVYQSWDGLDRSGKVVNNGVYVYKVIVTYEGVDYRVIGDVTVLR